ncbi:hypothetical protein KR018_003055 [Drosophila ironensis]|nr:hypothetical protein KR018_003055 [Drosophila ironensis]
MDFSPIADDFDESLVRMSAQMKQFNKDFDMLITKLMVQEKFTLGKMDLFDAVATVVPGQMVFPPSNQLDLPETEAELRPRFRPNVAHNLVGTLMNIFQGQMRERVSMLLAISCRQCKVMDIEDDYIIKQRVEGRPALVKPRSLADLAKEKLMNQMLQKFQSVLGDAVPKFERLMTELRGIQVNYYVNKANIRTRCVEPLGDPEPPKKALVLEKEIEGMSKFCVYCNYCLEHQEQYKRELDKFLASLRRPNSGESNRGEPFCPENGMVLMSLIGIREFMVMPDARNAYF